MIPEMTSSLSVIQTPARSSGNRLRKNSSGVAIACPSGAPQAARGAPLELMAADHRDDGEHEEAERRHHVEEQILPRRGGSLLAVEQQFVVADDADERAVLDDHQPEIVEPRNRVSHQLRE